MIKLAGLVAIGSAILCAGCGSQLLPDSGPNRTYRQVRHHVERAGVAGLVKLSPDVVNILEEYGPLTLSANFGDNRPPPEIKLGIGDIVSVSIFEAAAGGLFIPGEASVRPGNFVALPNQPIDSHGNIFVPYAGQIPAAGKTPAQVDQEIVDRIKNRAIDHRRWWRW